jgi:catechol 2,3-dioxygenase-like lactoylglutathione lyase family enzyme
MTTTPPSIRFLSLFVPDLAAAARCYEKMLGVPPSRPSVPAVVEPGSERPASLASPAPAPHPFASGGPILFELGSVCLALYQCDGRTTHAGDVGIGLLARSVSELSERAAAAGGRVLLRPAPLPADGRRAAVLMLPDRHFFEVLEQSAGLDG